MKKKLILTTLVLCFSLSFYAMEMFNSRLWSRINSTFGTNKIVFIMKNSNEFSRNEVVKLLIEGVKKYHVNLKTAYSSNGVQNAYLLLSDQEKVFSSISLVAKKAYDFSTPDQDVYFSTDRSDPDSAGYLYTVFSQGTSLVQYHSFHDIVDGNAQLYGWYNVMSEDLNQSKAFIEYLQENMPKNVQVLGMSYNEPKNESSRNEIILISFVLYLLLMFLEVSKNMKEISLRKSLGESFIHIVYDLFNPFFITSFVGSFAFFILSYLLLIRTFNSYTLEYIGQLGSYFLFVSCMTIFLLLILGSVIYMISPVNIIKNRNLNQAIYNFNYILKIVFIVFLFPQILVYSINASKNSLYLADYLSFQNVIKSNVAFVGLNPNSKYTSNSDELTKQSRLYLDYAIENSNYYLNYQEQDLPEELLPDSRKYENYQYIEITKNFFEYYPIDVKEINLKSIEEPIILVNKDKRKEIGFYLKSICQECKIIITTSSYSIPDFKAIFHASYSNPVLLIYPSIKNVESKSAQSFYYYRATPLDAIQKRNELVKHFDNNWAFTNNENTIKRSITDSLIKTYYATIVLIQSLATLLLIVLHGITVLYELNKKEIAIHYFTGYSFLQRSSFIVFQDVLLFGLLWVYLVMRNFTVIESLFYALCVMLLNLCIASIHLFLSEKKQSIDALKNN